MADFPVQLPSAAAISCVNIVEQITVYVFQVSPRNYGVDLPDFRKLTPEQQLDSLSRLDYFDTLPRLFPRSHVELDRSQIPVKLIFRMLPAFLLEIDIANPQNYLGLVKYVGRLEFTVGGYYGSPALPRIVQVDCLQGSHGPLHSL